jgi:hypothetical protein
MASDTTSNVVVHTHTTSSIVVLFVFQITSTLMICLSLLCCGGRFGFATESMSLLPFGGEWWHGHGSPGAGAGFGVAVSGLHHAIHVNAKGVQDSMDFLLEELDEHRTILLKVLEEQKRLAQSMILTQTAIDINDAIDDEAEAFDLLLVQHQQRQSYSHFPEEDPTHQPKVVPVPPSAIHEEESEAALSREWDHTAAAAAAPSRNDEDREIFDSDGSREKESPYFLDHTSTGQLPPVPVTTPVHHQDESASAPRISPGTSTSSDDMVGVGVAAEADSDQRNQDDICSNATDTDLLQASGDSDSDSDSAGQQENENVLTSLIETEKTERYDKNMASAVADVEDTDDTPGAEEGTSTTEQHTHLCSLGFCLKKNHTSFLHQKNVNAAAEYYMTKAVYPLKASRFPNSPEWDEMFLNSKKKLPPPPPLEGCHTAILIATMDHAGAEWQMAIVRSVLEWLELSYGGSMYWNLHAHAHGQLFESENEENGKKRNRDENENEGGNNDTDTDTDTDDTSFDFVAAFHEWGTNLTSNDRVIMRTPYVDDKDARNLCKRSVVVAGYRSLQDIALLFLSENANGNGRGRFEGDARHEEGEGEKLELEESESLQSLWRDEGLPYMRSMVMHQRRWWEFADMTVPFELMFDSESDTESESQFDDADANANNITKQQMRVMERGVKVLARDVCLMLTTAPAPAPAKTRGGQKSESSAATASHDLRQKCGDLIQLDALWQHFLLKKETKHEMQHLFQQQEKLHKARQYLQQNAGWHDMIVSLERTFRSWQEPFRYFPPTLM